MAASKAAKKNDARAQVNAYLAAVPPAPRMMLKRLREQIRAAAPGAVDGFTYRMPCLRVDDRPLIWYAAFKEHVSLFPMTAPIVRPLAKELRGYETAKGTIRIPFDRPLSATLVRKLVKGRLRLMNQK